MTAYEMHTVVSDMLLPLKFAAVALVGFLLLFKPDDDPPAYT